MPYCRDCMLICDDTRCPNCGSKKLTHPGENDPVYLITKDFFMSGIVEDILRQNDIPFLKQGTLGEAITSRVGYGTESYNFFIPFGAMIKAKELLADIFCAETDGAH